MHARVTKAVGEASGEETRRFIKERVIPGVKQMDGFVGGQWLFDRDNKTVLGITVFETEEQMRASDEVARQIREQAAERLNARFEVEYYEVLEQEMPMSTAPGAGRMSG